MSLESVNNKLLEVLNQLQSNNRDHYHLNEAILEQPQVSKAIETTGDPTKSQGFLHNINSIVNMIDEELNFQRVNVNRTSELVHAPETATLVKGY